MLQAAFKIKMWKSTCETDFFAVYVKFSSLHM